MLHCILYYNYTLCVDASYPPLGLKLYMLQKLAEVRIQFVIMPAQYIYFRDHIIFNKNYVAYQIKMKGNIFLLISSVLLSLGVILYFVCIFLYSVLLKITNLLYKPRKSS